MGIERRLDRLERLLRAHPQYEPLPKLVLIEVMNREQVHLAKRVEQARWRDVEVEDVPQSLRFHEFADLLDPRDIPAEDKVLWDAQVAFSRQTYAPQGKPPS